jgi:hypothetical protein
MGRYTGIPYLNLFLFLNFIPALVNIYYINLYIFPFLLTVYTCFDFKKYIGTSKFLFRALLTGRVLVITSTTSRRILGATQPPIHRVCGSFPGGARSSGWILTFIWSQGLEYTEKQECYLNNNEKEDLYCLWLHALYSNHKTWWSQLIYKEPALEHTKNCLKMIKRDRNMLLI